MTRKMVLEKLTEIFRDVFDDDSLILREDMTPEDIEDWDSLEQVNLVMAIEKKFRIRFNMEEANKFGNISKIIDTVLKKSRL